MRRTSLTLLAVLLALLGPALRAQTYVEAWLTSSYDGAVTRSVIMIPSSYSGVPVPLLVTLHGMGGDGWSALAGFDALARETRIIA